MYMKFDSTLRNEVDLEKIKSHKNKKYENRIFYDRSSTIPKCFKNYVLKVHKGRGSRILHVNGFVVGNKFGEFGYTRKPFHFPVRKKKGRQIKR